MSDAPVVPPFDGEAVLFPQPEPVRFKDAHGVQRLRGRRWALIIGDRFYCPKGHRLSDTNLALDHHVFRCTFREKGTRREDTAHVCGLLVYVVTHLSSSADERGPKPLISWALEVTFGEVRWMQRQGIRQIADVQRYLGGFWDMPQRKEA